MKKSKKIFVCVLIIILFFIIAFTTIQLCLYSNALEVTQLSPNSNSQMMGYILKTKNGKIIVIDGGTDADCDNLYRNIIRLGGKVDIWILTHPHNDHVGAFCKMVSDYQDIEINKVYCSINDLEFIKQYDSSRYSDAEKLNNVLKKENIKDKLQEAEIGDSIIIDKLNIEILGVKNPDITVNAGNNSSMIFKVYINNKSILFLGDTGIESSKKLISRYGDSKIKSTVVQMAHHGQAGVDEEFYKIVDPKICMWPTPEWLWNNDNGNGKNSGNWKTLQTRDWMSKLNVKKNYVAKDGDITFKLW